MRAAGAGKRVSIAPFVKGKIYSEIEAVLKYISDIIVKQYGLGCFIVKEPTLQDIDAAMLVWKKLPEYSKVVDIMWLYSVKQPLPYFFNLFSLDELIKVINRKKPETELIITGGYVPDKLIEFADLVTEMLEEKHYYTRGVEARKGIEY